MPWILEHYPAREEWEKSFASKAEAVAELAKHICGSCKRGCWGCADEDQCDRGCEKNTNKVPKLDSARDLLSTPCGCEYGLHYERKARRAAHTAA